MQENAVELLALDAAMRELVSQCEITGRRTIFRRAGRDVAILVSHDEYAALRETIDIAADETTLADLDRGEDEMRRGALFLPEDLFVE